MNDYAATGLVILGFLLYAWSALGAPETASTTGTASWYGREAEGRAMANGQPFDPSAFTCACWEYPLGTKLRVSTPDHSVIVTVTDRGPARRLHRVIDLSEAAFSLLAEPKIGLIEVTITKMHQ
jgi:rare lipoprotein A